MHVSFDLHLIDSPHHALPTNALPSDETMVKGNGRVKASYHQRKNHISLPVLNPITRMIKKSDGPVYLKSESVRPLLTLISLTCILIS